MNGKIKSEVVTVQPLSHVEPLPAMPGFSKSP